MLPGFSSLHMVSMKPGLQSLASPSLCRSLLAHGINEAWSAKSRLSSLCRSLLAHGINEAWSEHLGSPVCAGDCLHMVSMKPGLQSLSSPVCAGDCLHMVSMKPGLQSLSSPVCAGDCLHMVSMKPGLQSLSSPVCAGDCLHMVSMKPGLQSLGSPVCAGHCLHMVSMKPGLNVSALQFVHVTASAIKYDFPIASLTLVSSLTSLKCMPSRYVWPMVSKGCCLFVGIVSMRSNLSKQRIETTLSQYQWHGSMWSQCFVLAGNLVRIHWYLAPFPRYI